MSKLIHTQDQFVRTIRQISGLNEAIELMAWDLRTGAPRRAAAARSETIGELSGMAFRLGTSDQFGEWIQELESNTNELDERIQKMVKEAGRNYRRSKNIPADAYQAYVALTAESESVWEEAKAERNFAKLQPYLEKIVGTLKAFIPLWDTEGLATSHPYNVLLDAFEPGFTVRELDDFFAVLRKDLVPFVQELSQGPLPEQCWMGVEVPIEQQKKISQMILDRVGFDWSGGRLDESEHPFMVGLHNSDVRITTRYIATDVMNAISSSLHEYGHALYEQQVDDQWMGTNLAAGTSMGVHESQSRFWENGIGRSRAFWQGMYPALQKELPNLFGKTDFDAFLRGLNRVERGLIRIDADELTYSLHVLVRYELEKALFSGSLAVADLPTAWNDLYQQVLGIRPQHDGEGVLQDVHWSGGAFGYFPSYAIGNVYAAQIQQTMQQQMPTFDSFIRDGQFSEIKTWLREQIHRFGSSVEPKPLMERVTGQAFAPQVYVQQLRKKYSELYLG